MTSRDRTWIQKQFKHYYDLEWNCARTILHVLEELYQVPVHPQVYHGATGLHGAGRYGAQCGLLEGGLIFLGVAGKAHGFEDSEIVEFCYDLAGQFEKRFGSLLCRDLRPQGFHPDNPPDLCLPISVDALIFIDSFLADFI